MEVLQHRGMDQIFQTDSIKSFISELNLYGFSKICPSGLSQLQLSERQASPPAEHPEERRPRNNCSACCQPNSDHEEKEASKKVQKGTPPAHRTPSWCSFVFSGLWSMGSVAGRAGRNYLPSEQGGHSGEGTSSNATYFWKGWSRGTAREPPDYDSVMALHNTCYSILMVALSVMAPDEASEAEE
ncbi:hypothetical protein Celaphus_00009620 [Cervus elaphus hippelaphus]|uniref:HSF-type DNA-binding domain-containing protein n=1 Tax=Cervus elaphus hippelaphus TaxID=46360 RepID=A0A212BZF6_CEREH|nr:hypothetical protein Celaphus_00009620 [Cervus elaphus hippelaphus]